MRRAALFALTVALVLPLCGRAADDRSLFAQSAAALLQRDFAAPGISYLLLDAKTGAVLAARWDDPERPIPMGSLVKPFIAVAYAQYHDRFPAYSCSGGRGCWLPRGHGRLDIEHAIALSCNSYFRSLAAGVGVEEARQSLQTFGIDVPSSGPTAEQMVGLDPSWRIAPVRMARAYRELVRRSMDPGVREVLAGMAESARAGTGKGIDEGLDGTAGLAKTGTAPCTHGGAPGDGFAVAIDSGDAPAILLLVRVHGVPGSHAAVTAGKMLRDLEERTASRD